MKKILRIILITIGVIIILLITLPIVFKSKIEAMVKDQVNQNIHATVDWSRFSLSLFRGFPNLSVNLHGVSVVGLDLFEGDTLVGLKRFEFQVNPFSAIKKDIQVKSILLDQPLINGIVLEDGSANWDIVPPTDVNKDGSEVTSDAEENKKSETEEPAGPASEDNDDPSMGVSLERFAIRDARIYYTDEVMGAQAAMEDLDLELKGDFSMEQTDLDLMVTISGIDARYGGIRYMRDGRFSLDIQAAADMVNSIYTLKRNEIKLNGLVLGAEGMVTMLEDGAMDIDLSFFSRETSFKTLLSMVPAVYLEDFESLKTSGSIQLDGVVKGIFRDTLLPDATLNLQVSDGYFAYPDLPKDVSDVQIGLKIDYKGVDMDQTRVDLDHFHLLLGGNPFDLKLQMDHPISDMHVMGTATGMIDFATLKDVIPMDDVDLEGRLDTDLSWDTRMSYIDQEQFEKVQLDGSLLIERVKVQAPDIPVPVTLQKMEMVFNPRIVELVTLDLNMGSSDVHLDGELSNFIPFVFDDKTVSGALNVSSELLNINELMPQEEQDSEEETVADSTTVSETAPPDSIAEPVQVRIPENIDFNMTLDMKRVEYDQMLVENIQGNLEVKEGIATLDELSLNVIEGSVITTGTVDTRGEFAEVDVLLEMVGVDIPSSYETFVTVERLAPMAQYCKGTANIEMTYHSLLDASFNPLYESINAKGNVFTKGLQIYNLNSFVKLSELLKNEKFRNMAPDEVQVRFTVRDGRVIVDPFDMDFDDSRITVSGSHGIDLTMDYKLDMEIAKSDLGSGANDVMNGISALAAGAGFKVPQSDFVKVKAMIKGTFKNPKISTDLSENLKSTGETLKTTVEQKVTEEVEKVEEQVRDEASEKADAAIQAAEEEAARLIEEAKKAGDQLVKEAEKQGENLVKEAGNNPIKQIAARRAADELNKQALKQSENLVKEAEEKAAAIIEKARTESDRI